MVPKQGKGDVKKRRLVDKPIGGGWSAYGPRSHPIFIGRSGGYDRLDEALRDGLLRDVARSRVHTQEEISRWLGCSVGTVGRWWRGRQTPRGMYRRILVAYLLRG